MAHPAHEATTRHLGALYPFVSEPGLASTVPRWTAVACWWGATCWVAPSPTTRSSSTAAGLLTNPNMVVIGQIGRGKSAFVKTYLWRQAVFGRRAWVVDPKGEYGALARAWGVEPVALRPGGAIRLNPLDAVPAPTDSGPTTRTWRAGGASCWPRCAPPASGRPLLPAERSALELAVADGLGQRRRSGADACRPWSTRCCIPMQRSARAVGTDVAGLAADGRNVALELRRLVAGDLRGMFDGPTSPGFGLDAPARGPRPLGRLPLGRPGGPHDLRHRLVAGRPRRRCPHRDSGRATRRRGRGGGRGVGHPRQPGRGPLAPVVVEAVAGAGRVQRGRAAPAVGPRRPAARSGPSRSAWPRGCWRTPRPASSTPSPPARSSGRRRCWGCRRPKRSSSPTCDGAWRCGRSGTRSFLVQHRLSPHEAAIVDTDARMDGRDA